MKKTRNVNFINYNDKFTYYKYNISLEEAQHKLKNSTNYKVPEFNNEIEDREIYVLSNDEILIRDPIKEIAIIYSNLNGYICERG